MKPTPPLRRLLYSSHCSIPEGPAGRSAAAAAIASASKERNAIFRITGCLILVEGSFIQVLEGDAPGVEAVFESICCDFRHHEVKLIDYSIAEKRLFDRWQMAFLSGEDHTTVQLRDNLQDIRFLIGVNAPEAVRQMRAVLTSHCNSETLDRAA